MTKFPECCRGAGGKRSAHLGVRAILLGGLGGFLAIADLRVRALLADLAGLGRILISLPPVKTSRVMLLSHFRRPSVGMVEWARDSGDAQ
jgi:hypothetical protein